MAQMTTYTVRHKRYVDKDKIVQDEVIYDSPYDALAYVNEILKSPFMHSYRIIKEESLSKQELEEEVRDILELVKKS